MATIRIKSVLFATLVGALVIAVLYTAFVPAPVPVDLVLSHRGPMSLSIDAEGHTRVHDIYTVSAPVSGRVHRVEVHVGDKVVAGKTLLAAIAPAAPQFLDARAHAQAEATAKASGAARALAQAELNRALAELSFAQANLRRAQDLFAKKTIPEREFDQAKLDAASRTAQVHSARATLEVKKFELETAKAALITPSENPYQPADCCVEVFAPVDGTVLRVLRQSEGVVERASPLIEIGDPNQLEIVADLLSSDAVRVQEGAFVVLNGWGGDATTEGRVRRVEPYGFTKVSALGIEEQRVNVIIDFVGSAEERPRLGHGFRVEAHIREWQANDVLQVPVGTLFHHQGDWAVFANVNGTAKRTVLSIGHMNGRYAEVLEGLDDNAEIISHPSDRISDGIRISVRRIENEPR